ncbi:PREDICTED: adhesion G-protein coupled receptor G2-like [Acropora digitifera]|uniref:adhesion G-protein coupled receptor G2-like n=1 Tax=Acropora digitifera TaxID=70779 RepID=UPI00077A9F6A|nr:PREDICTED: adhesion G-protein coupled receptor G2-like [Acropora digitifera]
MNARLAYLETLNVTDKDSLQNAVKIIQNLFDKLKGNDEEGNGTVNVLVATKQLESFAVKYATVHFTENQSGNFSEENYEMKIQRLAANNTDPLVFYVNDATQQFEKDWVGIELPSEALKGKNISIFIVYNKISQFVPKFPTLELQNRIIAANVYPSPQGILQENVTISFDGRDKFQKEVTNPRCMFWNFKINSTVNGNWSEEGCSLKKSDDNKIICVCNHLTNFAVLMQFIIKGCPAGIVVLSIVLAACQEGGLHSYIHGAFCWVSFSNNLIWTFVAPVLLVCLTNAVLLSLVIREILKMQSDKPSNVENLRQAAKACVVLSPLLGMTWAFGILSVTNAGLIFQYIFTILNSLQGFFIFLLYILRSADVRAEFKRKKRMWFEMRGRVLDLHDSDKWTSKTLQIDVVELKDEHGVSSSHLSSRNKNQIVPFQEPLPSVECH